MGIERYEGRTDGDERAATPSETVIWAVSEAVDVNPIELRCLHEVVDTDALDALFRGKNAVTVTFEYHGYTVTVCEDGEVILEEFTLAEYP